MHAGEMNMFHFDQDTIKKLEALEEELESLGLNDNDGWQRLGDLLAEIKNAVPEKETPLVRLLDFCRQGCTAIAHEKAANAFSMVGAIADAVALLRENGAEGSLSAEAMDGAIKMLEEELGDDAAAEAEKVDPPAASADAVTIDDIAAALMQTDADDDEGVKTLFEMVQSVQSSSAFSSDAQLILQEAAADLKALQEGTAQDPQALFTRISENIERLVDLLHHPSSGSETTPEGAGDEFPPEMLNEMMDDFLSESSDLMAEAEKALLELETNAEDQGAINQVFRAFHTVKGSSNILKFSLLAELCHHAENLLSRMREGEIACSGAYADLALQSVDQVKELVASGAAAGSGSDLPKPEGYDELMLQLQNPDAVDEPPSEAEPSIEAQAEALAAVTAAVAPEEDTRDYMPEDADFELIGEFIDEGNDLISSAEEALLTLESDPEDEDSVATVFRAFHTVKGSAAFMELTLLAELGHHAETLLSRVRDKEIRYSGGYADLALRSIDMIKELLEAVKEALGGEALLKPQGYNELMHLLEDPEKAGISETQVADAEPPRIGDILVAQGKVDRESVEAAAAPRVGDILVAQGVSERESVEAAIAEHKEKPVGTAIVKSDSASVTQVGKAIRTQKQMKKGQVAVQSSIRVATDRLDRLIDTVGELVIAHSMVSQDTDIVDGGNHDLLKKVTLTSKIVRELQDMSMSLRMVPLKSTFQSMVRLVRDVSRKVGKNVTLIMDGEDTEIDRNMSESIKDPLVHMIRNSVDHGIEMPEERQAVGKPVQGQVFLSAYHSAGSVVVEIKDDGKGLNRDVILAKAIERELVSEDANLSDAEIYNLIFEPGFSTAQTVTDVSGRGVGMDVVRRNIESIGGQAEISSEPGKGCTFQIRLPLTLAIIDGMVARVGQETYVIPTISIVTSIKPEVDRLTNVFGKGEMLSIQGRLIPIFRMGNLLDIDNAQEDLDEALIVVVEHKDKQAGLVIDELIGRQQVVIKSLGGGVKEVPGISGGAIMPNGCVGLILDVGGLVRLANRGGRGNAETMRQNIAANE